MSQGSPVTGEVELRALAAEEWRKLVRGERRRTAPLLDGENAGPLARWFDLPIAADQVVRTILDDVAENGDAAVRRWTHRLDGIEVAVPRVGRAEFDRAWEGVEQPLRNALVAAAARIREIHVHQLDTAFKGTPTAQLRPLPLRRVGCYVPGGRAAYPSTVLMNVIPAQVAAVAEIAITSPPGPDGRVHPHVLAAARHLGVDEVHAIGGAQAIGALAHGTESVVAVDKITGPGNLFVTLAKRAVFGLVGIDSLAGPSEILVIASTGADPRLVAADLVSQLEHDPLAWAVCLTDDPPLAEAVRAAFAEEASSAARSGIIAAAAGRHGAVVVVESLNAALRLADEFAAEHLSLQGDAAEALRHRPHTAGAVYVGRRSPVSIGDYVAGPNHTLPTGGAARFGGPLSVMDFQRWPSVVELSAAEFDALAPVACILAEAEGLRGHERAIRLRMEEPG
ncbi:MAG TPA: histidinol dehydrogenase [Candidatus Binatia bacterium]|nr:histidinol dehydrogenase [Candidatus Binatia bacterium]